MTGSRRFDSLDEWLAWLATLHPKQIDMSLGRVRGVLEALGISDPPYRVITVAGTNGKGSCVALLESIYRAAGFAVGAFTSPHLIAFNERIRFDGRDVDDETLVGLFAEIDAARGELTLSYFEASAVAAMLHFANAGADVAILEVGMGGRLDAVNAIDADAALIVSIDLDHIEWLGPDRDAIGREKAGIVRRGRPVIVADGNPPAGLLDEIEKRGGVMQRAGIDFVAEADGDSFDYRGRRQWQLPMPRFGGRVQMANAAAVVAVVEAMQEALPVAESAVREGLVSARVRGRFEMLNVAGSEWVFDVAHNAAAAEKFHQALAALPRAEKTLAVFGAMHDKDLGAVLTPFVPLVDQWFVGGIDSDRGAPPASVAALLGELGAREVSVFADVAAATRAAQAAQADRVLAFGSFYTVGPALETLGIY